MCAYMFYSLYGIYVCSIALRLLYQHSTYIHLLTHIRYIVDTYNVCAETSITAQFYSKKHNGSKIGPFRFDSYSGG